MMKAETDVITNMIVYMIPFSFSTTISMLLFNYNRLVLYQKDNKEYFKRGLLFGIVVVTDWLKILCTSSFFLKESQSLVYDPIMIPVNMCLSWISFIYFIYISAMYWKNLLYHSGDHWTTSGAVDQLQSSFYGLEKLNETFNLSYVAHFAMMICLYTAFPTYSKFWTIIGSVIYYMLVSLLYESYLSFTNSSTVKHKLV